jgi:hypothetical protein
MDPSLFLVSVEFAEMFGLRYPEKRKISFSSNF